jgi:hypothetical protein
MTSNKHEQGQAIIIIAFAIVALVGFAALAIDGSRILSDRRHAQNAADTAAYAAALANTKGQDLYTAGQNRATSNGYDNGVSNDVTVTVAGTTPGICPSTGKEITVTIISYVPTTFARVIGWAQVKNTVNATARSCDVAGGVPLYNGSAVQATKTDACSGSNDASLYVNGSGKITIWGGNLGSTSSDPNCLRFQGGQTYLDVFGTDCADIVSGAPNGGTFNNVHGENGCGATEYNKTFDPPPPDLGITCPNNASWSGGTMTPGNYTGNFPPGSVDTLQPGTYCIDGNFTMNANQKLTGNGVTIVMNTGTVKLNGSSEAQLSAPTSGDYKGLLIYAPPSNSYTNTNNEINIDGSGSVSFTGTVLAQNLPCYYAGSGDIQQAKLQFICYTWGMDGNGQAEIIYDSSVLFSPIFPPTITMLQ